VSGSVAFDKAVQTALDTGEARIEELLALLENGGATRNHAAVPPPPATV
jgi:hypothetical protein